GVEVVDLELDAVPAAGRGRGAVGQGLAGAAPTWGVQQQPEVVPPQHGEARAGVHLHLEAEVPVEGDGLGDGVDDVAHTCHGDLLVGRPARRTVPTPALLCNMRVAQRDTDVALCPSTGTLRAVATPSPEPDPRVERSR